MRLTPESFEVPENLEAPDFIIRKLMFRDAKLDYEAVMSSIEIIKKTRGGDWPESTLTFEDDQIDLAWHQREFENGTSFAYTVMKPDETECLGCLYLYPPGHRSETSKEAEVDVSFWVTQKAFDQGLYPVLYKTLDDWLKSAWPFKRVVYTNQQLPK
jgi:hypothetical protein